MIHRGEILEREVRKSGLPITEVAKRLGKSRRHVYNLFEDPNVSLDVVLQIGKIIHYDFSQDISSIKSKYHSQTKDHVTELTEQKSASYWKDKYLRLLEKYNHLLEQKNDVL